MIKLACMFCKNCLVLTVVVIKNKLVFSLGETLCRTVSNCNESNQGAYKSYHLQTFYIDYSKCV